MRVLRMLVLVLSALAMSVGCAKEKRALSDAQKQTLSTLIKKEPPKPQHPLAIKFGDQVTLLGYDLSAPSVAPGKSVTVTWHYRVDKEVSKGFRLFTHLADGGDVSRVNLDQTGPLRELSAPDEWQPGSYVTDPQTIALPADWKSEKAVVYLGFWKGSGRLPVTGPSDGANRARALSLDVAGVVEELATLVAPRNQGEIKLDGKLDEAAWKEAKSTGPLVNTLTGAPADPNVIVKSAWDDTNLYVAFDVTDDFLKSTFDKDDDHLWEQDCVEIMVDPDGDGLNYFELQVSPKGKSFDTRYDSRRVPRPFGHMDWNAGLKNGIALRGTPNDDQADNGYTAEIAIPWTAFKAGDKPSEPPKPGERWRINFYVMDAREKGMRSVGWSPPRVGDFHVPRRFGKVEFRGDGAAAGAAPVTASDKSP